MRRSDTIMHIDLVCFPSFSLTLLKFVLFVGFVSPKGAFESIRFCLLLANVYRTTQMSLAGIAAFVIFSELTSSLPKGQKLRKSCVATTNTGIGKSRNARYVCYIATLQR